MVANELIADVQASGHCGLIADTVWLEHPEAESGCWTQLLASESTFIVKPATLKQVHRQDWRMISDAVRKRGALPVLGNWWFASQALQFQLTGCVVRGE